MLLSLEVQVFLLGGCPSRDGQGGRAGEIAGAELRAPADESASAYLASSGRRGEGRKHGLAPLYQGCDSPYSKFNKQGPPHRVEDLQQDYVLSAQSYPRTPGR